MSYSREELKSLIADMDILLKENQIRTQKKQQEISKDILRTTRVDKDTLNELVEKLLGAAHAEKKKRTATLLNEAAYTIIKLAAARRNGAQLEFFETSERKREND